MKFRSWSLKYQLTCLFASATFILAVVLISLTVGQLLWIKSSILRLSGEEISDFFESRMDVILSEEKQMIELYFKKHISRVSILANLFAALIKESPVLVGEPVWSDQENLALSYENGAFFSKHEQRSAAGTALVGRLVAMDKFWKHLFNQGLDLMFYGGFNTDDLLYFYPQDFFDQDYTPYSREWFYNANNTSGDVYITDPYQDTASGEWIITFSKGIIVEGTVEGVVGVDVYLSDINALYSEKAFGEHGFELLVSKNGIVLGSPAAWGEEGALVFKVDDTSRTGFSTAEWVLLSDPATDKQAETFTDSSGSEFIFKKVSVSPFSSGAATHFTFVCASQAELSEEVDHFREQLGRTHNIILGTIVSIACLFFFVVLLLI